jgi:hypothetical protein
MAGLTAVAFQTIIDRTGPGRRIASFVSLVAAVLISALVLQVHLRERRMLSGWYEAMQSVNRRMLISVNAVRDEISQEQVVGLWGLEGLSPWSNNNGCFLRAKWRFPNSWTVFVPSSSIFYQIGFNANTSVMKDVRPTITVADASSICSEPEMLVIKFDNTGNGSRVRAKDLCNQGKPAE